MTCKKSGGLRANFPILLLAFLTLGTSPSCGKDRTPIKIGILHSLSGTMAISERPVVDALLLAVEEINRNGGVLGRRLQPVIADGQSDWNIFAKEAERLIVREKTAAVFGCWTSACRKAVRPVFEKHSHLLFYPVQYEGLEQSPNIVYMGAVPNQQITPAVAWALRKFGGRFYLIGSDYVFPRAANRIIRDVAEAQGARILAERYVPLGSRDFASITREIKRLRPDIILNTINGDSNVAFFRALRSENRVPVLSFSIAEPEIKIIGKSAVQEHYAAWTYFQSLSNPENRLFLEKFKKKFGKDAPVNDPMVAAYNALHIWALAARHADSWLPRRILRVLGKQNFNAPEGIVSIDKTTQHAWRTARIGKALPGGQFSVVWESRRPIRPVPFPSYRNKMDWNNILRDISGKKR